MLSAKDAVATVAVKSLETAAKFYEQTLGLTKIMENEEVLAFQSGKSTLFVYRSQYAGTNKATAVTWVVDEIEEIVKTLKGRGVSFEHYDLPNLTRQGDLHVAGTMKTAWFKDPDGNIFSLVTPPNTVSRPRWTRKGPTQAALFTEVDLGVESYRELAAKSRPTYALVDPARLAGWCRVTRRRIAERTPTWMIQHDATY